MPAAGCTTSGPAPPDGSRCSTPPSCSRPSTPRPVSSSPTTPGGADALLRAVENVEDDADRGRADLEAVTAGDVVVGLTASGRTPYVRGALTLARERGALTALVTANPRSELAGLADHCLAVETGPEVITGSTRLKAGTAQKLVLNAFSTALMIRLGRTWSNLMVDVVATNAKLRGRVVRILRDASGATEDEARAALEATDGELKPALVTLLAGVDAGAARTALDAHDGSVARALTALDGAPTRAAAPDHQHLPDPRPDRRPRMTSRSPPDPPRPRARRGRARPRGVRALVLERGLGRRRRHHAHRVVVARRGQGRLREDLRRLRGLAPGGHRRLQAVQGHRVQQDPRHRASPGRTGPTCRRCGPTAACRPPWPPGALEPLDDAVDLSSWDEGIVAGARGKEDGKLYSVPLARQATVLFYDKKLFSENGVEVPTTWDDFIAANETFLSKGHHPAGRRCQGRLDPADRARGPRGAAVRREPSSRTPSQSGADRLHRPRLGRVRRRPQVTLEKYMPEERHRRRGDRRA